MTKIEPKTILIYVGAERIGDGIYKLPFITHLRTRFPGAKITWVAGKGHTVYAKELAPMVEGLLDEVIDEAEIGRSWREMTGPRPLAGRRFDLVIETGRVFRTTLIVKRIRHRWFVSAAVGYLFSSLWPRPLSKMVNKPPTVVGLLSELAEVVTGSPIPPGLKLRLDPVAVAEAAGLLPPGPNYVGLAPGANDRIKCWPLDNYIAVARHLSATGFKPVFFMGPNESDWTQRIRAEVPDAALPLQAASAMTPWLTIALGHNVAAAITNDCGAAHLLAAASVPLVSLFGPTRSEKFAPATPRLTILNAQSWGGNAMDLIPVPAAIAALEGLLGA